VIKGTNRAALEADIDILAHPGLISNEDARLAAKKGIFLEITSRKGHCETNAHVAEKAREFKAKLIVNNDSHAPEDIISPDELIKTLYSLGLGQDEIDKLYKDVRQLIKEREGEWKSQN
jgi:histidinol phosphatase-like PHP family hydrolase